MTVAVASIPLGYLLVRLLQAEPNSVQNAIFRQRTLDVTLTSLSLSLCVALGTLILGVPIAWALTHLRLPGIGLWRVLAALPLAIPSYVTAFSWLSLNPKFTGYWPLVAVLTFACTPYVTLPVMAAFRLADRRGQDVARVLGRGPLRAFKAALLPQILPAALAGALLAALYSLSDFGSPGLLRVQTLTWSVFAAYEGGLNRTLAAATALVLVVLALALVMLERVVRHRAIKTDQSNTKISKPNLTDSRRGRIIAMSAMGVLALLSLGIPAFALSKRALESRRHGIDWERLTNSTMTSLGVSFGGALITLILALPVAMLAARYRGRIVSALESLTYLSNGIPGIVVGLSLVAFTLNVIPGIYQTALALCLAYAVIFLPKAVGSIRSAIHQVPPELEDVSRSLGRGPTWTWASVTARLSSPGIAVGGLLVMVTALKELPATLMLLPIGSNTLATELWRHTTDTAYSAAAPYAIVLILVACIPAYFLSRTETYETSD